MGGKLSLRGGDARDPGGTGGLGGAVDIFSDANYDGIGGHLLIATTGVIDASGGAGTIGGSGRNNGGGGVAAFPDEMEMIAVLINCDGKHGTTENWLDNRGLIIARGGAANGNGGDIIYHGISPDRDSSPPSGNIDNAGQRQRQARATSAPNENKEHAHEPVISQRRPHDSLGGGADGRIGVLGRRVRRQRDLEERHAARRAARGGGVAGEGGATGGGGPAVPPEIDGQLVINELMAANALTLEGRDRRRAPLDRDPESDRHRRSAARLRRDRRSGGARQGRRSATAPSCPRAATWCVWLDGNPAAGPTHVAAYLSKAGGSVGAGAARRIVHRPARLRRAGDRPVGRARARRRAAPGRSSGTSRRARRIRRGAARRARPRPIRRSVPTAGDPSDRILGYDQMPQFSLTIGAAEIQSLLTAPDIVRAARR